MNTPAELTPEQRMEQREKLWKLKWQKVQAERDKAALETEIARLTAEIEVITGKVPF